MDTVHEVIVCGGGPIGMMLALQLSRYKIPAILLERSDTPTKWPKMDITNCRTMELLRKMHIAQGVRDIGVPPEYSFDVIFATGLSPDEDYKLGYWNLPSVDQCNERLTEMNNGKTSLEPYQRLSQAILEKYLRELCRSDPLIDFKEGVRVTNCQQIGPDRVEVTYELTPTSDAQSTSISPAAEQKKTLLAKYVAGCDGASSIVRRSMGIRLEENADLPKINRHLVHFKSKDLTNLHRHGQFWHIFFPHAGTIISQDEIDHFTCHQNIPADILPTEGLTPADVLKMILNTDIKVDEVMLFNRWRPVFAVSDQFCKGNVFLCGDACHQWNPTGGYGFNTGVGDAYDLGWKLALALRSKIGLNLLKSYEIERRPIAQRCMQRSQRHLKVHLDGMKIASLQEMRASPEIRGRMKKYYESHRGENEDLGIELGQRLYKSPIVAHEPSSTEPEWTEQCYVPSTWPGSRVPSFFLRDGRQLFDLFGEMFTLVDFRVQVEPDVKVFLEMSKEYSLDVTYLHLANEERIKTVWQKAVVIVRPDFYSAWRGDSIEAPRNILSTILGLNCS